MKNNFIKSFLLLSCIGFLCTNAFCNVVVSIDTDKEEVAPKWMVKPTKNAFEKLLDVREIVTNEVNQCIKTNEIWAIMGMSSIKKQAPYVYSASYGDIDYTFAKEYFTKQYSPKTGGCSAVRKGRFYGRNLDWYYDNEVDVVVSTPAIKNRHAVLGVASCMHSLTDEFVSSKNWSDIYKILPFRIVDGINDCGLVMNVNVVPTGDWGHTTGTHTNLSESISSMMLIRYVLDNFSTASNAVYYVRDNVNVYMSSENEVHFMVADANETYSMEFLSNTCVVAKMERPYFTNFYLQDMKLDESNHVDRFSITPFGSGVERYDLITDAYDDISEDNDSDIIDLMHNKLRYTNAYRTPLDWRSEMVGDYGFGVLTVTNTVEDFILSGIVTVFTNMFVNRSRETGETWQTVHTCIYDIENKTLKIIPQETNTILTYNIDGTVCETRETQILMSSDNHEYGVWNNPQTPVIVISILLVIEIIVFLVYVTRNKTK